MIKDKQIKYYKAKAKDLPPLTTGQTVMIEPDNKRQLWCKATVVGWSNNRPRSYDVETDTGRVLSRNRRHLKLTPLSTPQDEEDEQGSPDAEGEKEHTQLTNGVVSPEGQDSPYLTRWGRASKRPSYLKDYGV